MIRKKAGETPYVCSADSSRGRVFAREGVSERQDEIGIHGVGHEGLGVHVVVDIRPDLSVGVSIQSPEIARLP